MKATGFLLFAAASAMTLAGCSKEQQIGGIDTNPAEVRFTAGIEGSATATRTTGGGDAWVAGDGIGIYMLSGSGTLPSGILSGTANSRYNVANAATGALSPDGGTTPIQYPTTAGTIVDFVAYYPYGTPSAAGQLAVDLTDQSTPADIDVLTARSPGNVAGTAGAITLDFAHALSKVTINVRAGEDVPTADVEATTDVRLTGTPGSVSVNVNGGAVTDGSNAAIPMAKTTTTATYDATFTAIVAPSSGSGRTVILQIPNEGSVEWVIPDAFTHGEHYIYWGEIVASAFKVTASTIDPWNDNAETEIGGDLAARIQGNNRITWDGANSRYVLTTDPTDAGLYFKFGGVAGIYSGNAANAVLPAGVNTDTFDPADVAWSPVAITGTANAGWTTIPVYNGTTDYPAPIDAAYHTAANVKAGKGDPCRLVGLNLANIAATDAGALTAADIDNGKWRLPTTAEQQAYSGREANGAYTDHLTTLDGSGVIGGMFPDRTLGDATTFLPATGRRNSSSGAVQDQGAYGSYWSSTQSSATNGGYLNFNSTNVSPLGNGSYAYGLSVRCVRQ